MQVTLNGSKKEVKEGVTLSQFLLEMGLDLGKVVVEYNYDIVKKEDWININLKDNDNLEVLSFVGGG